MKNVGKTIGNWLIKARQIQKSPDGHALYAAQCIKCGYIKNDLRLSQAFRAKKCYHPSPANTFCCAQLGKSYRLMCRRCYNQADKAYRWYGGRGIGVCNDWLEHPEHFNSWAISSGYKPGLTIDRINPNKGYQPDNCRWVTASFNAKFKRTSRTITIDGVTDTLSGWARQKDKPRMFFIHRAKDLSDDELKELINKF